MGYVVLVIVAICGATDFGKVFASDDIVCYPQIGCIDNGPPFFDPLLRPIGNLPSTRAEVGTEFLLNTRSNPITPQFLDTNDISTITSSTFDPLKETKIVCHGYTESAYAAWMIEMVAELVNNDDFNIIRINWHKGATAIYGQSTTNTRVVAAEASYLLDVLKSLYGYSADKVHMIGHSLGSHIAGYVGASQQNPKLKRITGLDPAGPYFEDTDIVVRLDPSDATFVDAIHTDTDPLYTTGMGIYMPVAHFDYYVNGGHDQPGCDKGFINHIVVEGAIYQGGVQFVACEHFRSCDLFTESINSDCSFLSHDCTIFGHKDDGYANFIDGQCFGPSIDTAPLGFHSNGPIGTKENIIYFLRTRDQIKYCGYPLEFNVFIDDPGFLKGDKEKGNLFITLIGSLQQSERILLTPESFLMYPGEDYTFVAVSDVVTGPIVGAYFEWEYDPDWYKPWDWDLWVNPDIYLHKILIQDSDGTRYTMCGDDNKIQANKDVKTLFAVKDCK
ncbi:pancreatic triacylglycerol lipase-like [Anneissia japonica]|uniref:pancreatic triacylglycerol lipase-like n=1 Tax=Anneissia japonica TaxID=1529436 RepID=UPI0014255ECD|nr:pancreatic triacylglycerol lipase-like [Anneissia japonica]